MVDLLAGLNDEQRTAAQCVRGPLCILAGAGTGKTRTITHRIAHQIATGTARADQILALTFTDRAATELRHRLRAMGLPPVRAATFHAAAWAQLRHFWRRLSDEPLPEVLSSKLRLLIPLADRVGAEARDLASEIEWARARLLGPDEYAERAGARDAPLPPEQMAEVFRRYEQAKRRNGVLDYDDMLLWTLHALRREEVAAAVKDRYRFFTVDEYQDTNTVQHALLRAWLGDRDEICVVGDPNQTIYSFTGASSRWLEQFPREFDSCRTVRLSVNYRSTPQVLRVTNRLLAVSREAALRPLHDDQRGPDPELVEFPDAVTEVDAVVTRCRALVDGGVDPEEIAVLFRVNAQSEPYEEALRAGGLPTWVRGAPGFFTRPEVRQAVRVLQAEADDPGDPADLLGNADRDERPALRRMAQALRRRMRHDRERPPPGAVALDRWRNVEAVLDAAARHAGQQPQASYGDLVAELAARAEREDAAPGPGGAVTLATLHAAKGLEFDAVLVVGCEEGLLPITHASTPAEVEEERRLLYVGLTRARRHLMVSWARSRESRSGRPQNRRPSRFLTQLGARPASAPPRRGATTTGRTRAGGALAELEGEDAALAGRLREWRAARARRDEVPAFVVFADTTLAELATRRPTSDRELLAITGLGRTKVDRYGPELLELLGGQASTRR